LSGRRVEIDEVDNDLKIYNSDGDVIVGTGESVTIGATFSPSMYVFTEEDNASAGVFKADGTESTGANFAITSQGPTGVYGESTLTSTTTGFGVEGFSRNNRGVFGQSFDGVGITGVSSNGYGVEGFNNSGGSFDFYASGSGSNYGPFTGAHDGLLPKRLSPESGDILCSTGQFEKRSLSQTIPYLEVASATNSKSAYGIFVIKSDIGDRLPAALSGQGPSAKLAYIKENYDRSIANALGEGQINVCSESGDFEVGDFICTSNTAGKGMRYDGQDMRYVVAKCMEPVVWTDEPSNIKMVACVYMCG